MLVLYLLGPTIIKWLEISPKYVHLYYIDLVGVAAQVLMLAVLNVLFYLDRLKDALLLTATLLITNSLFTWLSLELGPVYYGYGFGLSMVATAFVGIIRLASVMDGIEYETFMADRRERKSKRVSENVTRGRFALARKLLKRGSDTQTAPPSAAQ